MAAMPIPPGEFIDLDHLVNEMRLIKSAAEIKLMRKAGEISARAHCRAMQLSQAGLFEYNLQAEIEHEFMASGAAGPAYTSIVGGGKNGCVLHYIENRGKLRAGDMVLIDAGCEYQDYAADITRTFPVNGKFSSAQAAIYDIVLAAQAAAIGEFIDLDHLVNEMRLIKSAAEIKLMRKAGEISARAHCRAMQLSQAGLFEYNLQAEIEHEFMASGAAGPAYTSIVGGGKNGCVLHYIENRGKLRAGDMVLIDAGCEYQDYAADITRTFPVNGKFSSAQAAIYDIVLAAQAAAIEVIAPGLEYHLANDATVRVITQGLVDLKILNGDVDELIEQGAHRDFYMHNAGHWLGMDVHDVGDYKIDNHWRIYEPGMVVTVEPGIYISPDNTNVDKKWRGIAVRIEDDVLVTKTGNEDLTSGVPKVREEIELLMAS